MKKIAFYTLGCKVNQDESEAFEGLFSEAGYEIVAFDEEADIYIINTCTVTHQADRKSRQFIRRAIKRNPQAKIIVTGCYAQTAPEDIAEITGVDFIIGTNGRENIVKFVEDLAEEENLKIEVEDSRDFKDFEEINVMRMIQRTRAYLKVQEGCEQFCTYCIIPYSRGPYRSRKLENALNEAKKLVAAGFKEIVLTGIHLGAYGKDSQSAEKEDIYSLCKAILDEVELERLRLSSIEPTEVTDELLELMLSDKRFCRHLHIPLQSGDDRILKAMNRPYLTDDFRKLVDKIRNKVKDIGITTDLIVGFPGEDDASFENTEAFVREMAFSGIHVFKYSARSGTPASKYKNQVEPEKQDERSKIVLNLAEEGFFNFAKKFLNKKVEVLVEQENSEGYWEGHTDNYLPVIFRGNVKESDIVVVTIKNINQKGFLEAEL